jgi:hypothetical protein
VKTTVECYAGARYPERPRAFIYQEKQLEVAEIEGRERTPRGLRFRVRVSDGRRFSLFYDEVDDAWEVGPQGPA